MLGTTRTSRSTLPKAFAMTLLLGASLALTACGAAQESGAAAIVNDAVISDQDVQTVTAEVNSISPEGEKLSLSNALLSLILEPYVLAEAEKAKKTVSDAEARKLIEKVADPSPRTISFVQMQMVLPALDQTARESIVKELGKAKITVNPRYGTFDPTQVTLTPASPNWIKPSATPPPQSSPSSPSPSP
jgi:hypothetical protein